MNGAYPAARQVASKVHAHLKKHHENARKAGRTPGASIPDADVIETIVDAAFWASLKREEIYNPKISLAYLSSEQTPQPMLFERSLSLKPIALSRVAPAVERPGTHLGVYPDGDGLRVWGTTGTLPTFCLVIEVAAPGLLVIKHHRGEQYGKFVNIAVLEGDQVKIVDESASSLPDCPELLTSLLGFDSPASWVGRINVLVQIAVSMRAHKRGGMLLVVPSASNAWHDSVVRPIPFAVSPAYTGLADLVRTMPKEPTYVWQESLTRVVDTIAGLTAVDGATVLTDKSELLAFGAKATRRKGSPQIENVTITEPIEGGVAVVAPASRLGGTRHLSAAQFIFDQRDAVALVASQDGRFTVFAWSPCEDSVHAHRVETLLL